MAPSTRAFVIAMNIKSNSVEDGWNTVMENSGAGHAAGLGLVALPIQRLGLCGIQFLDLYGIANKTRRKRTPRVPPSL
jgi:hypothetical protein